MASNRKGRYYKAYLDASQRDSAPSSIPESTWRGWLRTGKITRLQLRAMGIVVNERKRHKPNTVEVEDTIPDEDLLDMDVVSDAENLCETRLSLHSDISSASDNISVDESSMESCRSSSYSDLNSNVNSEPSFSTVTSCSDNERSDDEDQEISDNIDLCKIVSSALLSPNVLNQSLHPSLSISKFEVLLMILHLSMRHRMTDVFIEHLIEFVEQIVGIPNALGVSHNLFKKLFQFGRKPRFHFYCPDCDNRYLGTDKQFPSGIIECESEGCNWRSTVSSHNNNNFFLTLSIREQIRDVLSKRDLKFVPRTRLPHVMSDMMDGKQYRSMSREGKVLSNEDALTLTINTDGSPIFKSGPNSLWPVHLLINEIDLSQRFNPENIMLGGLWFGKREANVQMLLTPIVDELSDLENSGVVWRRPDGMTIESPVYVMCCCCDSVGRPKVQKHMQFNGAYGCSVCMHPNITIKVLEKINKLVITKRKKKKDNSKEKGDVSFEDLDVFRSKETMKYIRGDYLLRTNASLRDHMKLASVSPQPHIYGSRGISVMCDLIHFNVVYGFPIDWMHAILLGVMKKFAMLWFDSTSSGKPYYIGRLVERVDLRLQEITLPSGFRPPRPISDRVHWKANEWRAFLLYYGLAVLINVLPQVYYNHFKKLVMAIYTLTKESILFEEIEAAGNILREFVWEYQELYGEENMVYNVHITGHIAEMVANMGPLWAYSAFPFESANGRLVRLSMGTKGVATQICRKYIMTGSVCKLLTYNYQARKSILNYCCSILGYKYLKNFSRGTNDETMLGREVYQELTDVQRQAFIDKKIDVANVALVVSRVVFEGKLYHGRQTTRQKKACDSCVRLISGEYALIDLIVVCNRNAITGLADTKFVITKLNVSTEASPLLVSHIKQCCLDSFGDVEVITAQDISRKCIFFSCSDKNYVAEISNFYETD